MKDILKRLPALLLVVLFYGCSKDSPSTPPCTPIACLNGGVSRTDCSCDCPQGYTGTNCGMQITPSSVKITKIRVTKFPDSPPNGGWWDTFPNSDADIYITLVNSSGATIYTSPTYYTNATGLGTIGYDFIPATPISIANVTSPLGINLYDYEITIGSATLMTFLVFNPYTINGGFPPTITKTSSSGAFECMISLQYTW